MSTLGIVALLGVTTTGIIPNGNLEKGLEAWTAGDAGAWHVEKDAGRPHGPGLPPTAALVWERKEGDKKGSWIGNVMPVKPGTVYRITTWTTVDKLSGNQRNPGFSVGIGTKERYSKWCCGTRVGLNRFDELDLDGWHKITSVTPPIPGDANRMVLAVAVDGDAVGRVRFDDFVIEPVGERLIENLCCMAPGRAASAGPILFAATVFPDVTKYPIETIRPKLKWGGKERTMALTGTDLVELEVDASEFAMGENTVTLSLETADGKVLATDKIDFTRTEPDAKPRKTKFDARKRLLVNGKVTYPLGVYWHPDGECEEMFDLLAQSPFNFVIDYDKNYRREKLDRFHGRGIGVIASVAHCYPWIPYLPAGVTDAASAERHACETVLALKDHPALWGWYLVDEPTMDKIPSVLAQYRRVKRLDPDHVAGVVTWTPNDARMLSQCGDFFGVDTYPIGAAAATEVEKRFPPLAEITRECAISCRQTRGRVPLWQVPQAFSWARDHKKKGYWWMRFPTRNEYVSQVWQEIAGGADGMCFWIFTDIYREWKKGNRDAFYDLCSAAEDVRRLSPVLLSPEEPPKVSGADENLAVRAFLHAGKAYVIACNLTWKRCAATLTLSGKWQNPWTEVGASAKVTDGNRLDLDLPPIGVSVIRLEPAEEPEACRPAARFTTAPWWTSRLAETRSRIMQKKDACYDLVLVGDSITHRWENKANGAEVYPLLQKKYRVLNLGNGGDRTQNVIWRFENNGELDDYKAKVFAVMIGVNNGGTEPEGTVAGVKKIVGMIRAKHPESKVVLIAILPHGKNPRAAVTEKTVNPMLKAYAAESGCTWLDMNEKFLDEKGEIRAGLMMPDNLHPIASGYEIWLEEMTPVVDRLLGSKAES